MEWLTCSIAFYAGTHILMVYECIFIVYEP